MRKITAIMIMAMFVFGMVVPFTMHGEDEVSAHTLTAYSGKYTVTADASTDSANPSTNYGTATTTYNRIASSSMTKITYLRWNLTTIPTGSTITDVHLNIYADTNPAQTLIIYDMAATNWGENYITWSNAPGTGGTSGYVGITGDTGTGWKNYSVDDYGSGYDLIDLVSASFAIDRHVYLSMQQTGASTVEKIYESKENTYAPYLYIAYTYTAPPATWKPTFTSSPTTSMENYTAYSYHVTWNETVNADSVTTNASFLTYTGANDTLWGRADGVAKWYSVSLQATSTAGTLTAWQNYTLTVIVNPPWRPVFVGTPPAVASMAYLYEYYIVTNCTCTYALTKTNASWLSLTAGNYISGTPTSSPKSYYVNITATATVGGGTQYRNYTISVLSGSVWTKAYVTADTFIDVSYPYNNYGGSNFLYIYKSGSYRQDTLLRWNLSVPAGAIVTEACLVMYSSGAHAEYLYSTNAVNWAELQVTWNTQPGGASTLDAYSVSSGWNNFTGVSLTGYVNSQVQTGGGRVYLQWTYAGTSSNIYFLSKEYGVSWSPYLAIKYTVPSNMWSPTFTSTPVGNNTICTDAHRHSISPPAAKSYGGYYYNMEMNDTLWGGIFSMRTNASWLNLYQDTYPSTFAKLYGDTPLTTGSYWVNVSVYSANPTGSRYAHQNFTIYVDGTSPVVNAGVDQTHSQGYNIHFAGTAVDTNTGTYPFGYTWKHTNITGGYVTETVYPPAMIYKWTWTDGTVHTYYGATLSHVFSNIGVFNVTLTVYDNSASSGMYHEPSIPCIPNAGVDYVIITIQDGHPPTCVLTPYPYLNVTLHTAHTYTATFDVSHSTDNVGITNWSWEVGNGTATFYFYGVDHISFTFAENTTWYVWVQVKDAMGNSDDKVCYVNISAYSPVPPIAPLITAGGILGIMAWFGLIGVIAIPAVAVVMTRRQDGFEDKYKAVLTMIMFWVMCLGLFLGGMSGM